MSSVGAAIAGAQAALQAVNWLTAIGKPVTVDATPNRVWTQQERRAGPIVYLFGGGSDFELQQRSMVLLERPTLAVAVMHHCGIDPQGQLAAAGVSLAEAIVTQTAKSLRDWVKASPRFAPLQFLKPERFDSEQALKGEFLSTITLTLLDGTAL